MGAELRDLEQQCIQECAPPCQAACPIHIDVRAVLLELGRGEDDAALKALRRTLPFPGIISRVCDQPCRPVCKRSEAGDAIAIAALERACVDYGGRKDGEGKAPAQTDWSGGCRRRSLSGMTAALTIGPQGYVVTLYEALHPAGDDCGKVPEEWLPRAVIMDDFRAVEDLGVEYPARHASQYRSGSGKQPNGRLTLGVRLCERHDAVFLAVGGQDCEIVRAGRRRCGARFRLIPP